MFLRDFGLEIMKIPALISATMKENVNQSLTETPPQPPRGMELIETGVIRQGDFATSVYSGEWIEVFPDDIGLSVGIYDFVCRPLCSLKLNKE